MILCLCHPFSDKKAKQHMSDKGARCSVSEVYSTCSGGNKPNCCQCLETLKDMVKSHNDIVKA
jgi:bacterioferritin-associated ferredoxin